MKEKGDPCVMVGYSTQSKGYYVYNKRTRLIVESIHIKFDEIKEMMSDHNSSDLALQRQEIQNVVPTTEKTDSSHQESEFLFSPLIEEYYTPAHGQAKENNNDQVPNASFQEGGVLLLPPGEASRLQNQSPVLWAEIGESSLIGPELVQETTDKVVLIKEKLKSARDRQKSYADNRRKSLEFEIKVDKTLHFVKELVKNSDREIKRQAKWLAVRYLVKVSWNSKCNFELTWVWEDYLKDKYPRLIVW
ncbi:hypothetical protein Tco_1482284 [Tanacetum coccineum]